jgi:tetratricopeptide (TPR) repeat protein
MAAARARAAEAEAQMRDALAGQPNNADLLADLALAQGILGERENALASVQKSAELLPESRDAVNAPTDAVTCALALAWAGEKERALAEVQRLLRVPFGANVHVVRASFRPLQDDPRFKAMVSDPANNAPLL